MPKDERLYIRISPEDKKLIEDIAKGQKSTVSQFTIVAAVEKAKRILRKGK